MIKAVFFDLFSTLISVATVPKSIGAFTADVLGVSHDDWRDVCFSHAHEICQPTEHADVIHALAHELDASIPLERIQHAASERQKRFDFALIEHVQADVITGLSQLRGAGYSLALVSNASTAEVSAWPDSPLAALFDTAIFSCHCGFKKPDADIYHHASSLLNVPLSECVFVGDGGSEEFRGASELGMPVLMMTAHTSLQQQTQLKETYKNEITAEVASVGEVVEWLWKR